MNKFTLMLQDKEVIKELARDPEIQVKIKNSIVDEVKRRSSKGIDGLMNELTESIRKELFDRVGFYGSYSLKPSIRKLLENNIENIVRDIILDLKLEIDRKISEEMNKYRASISSRLNEVDISQIIREEAAKIVERKFG